MNERSSSAPALDPPEPFPLRVLFLVVWFADMVTACLLFVVPDVIEVNPVTVLFYAAFGLPGVALAASLYGVLVLAIGHYLSDPADRFFVALVAGAYTLFASNNLSLLVFDQPVLMLP